MVLENYNIKTYLQNKKYSFSNVLNKYIWKKKETDMKKEPINKLNQQRDGWMNEWMNDKIDEYFLNDWMIKWMNDLMVEWMNE